jgi:mediator of RNA polymerase II transcription subunit 6
LFCVSFQLNAVHHLQSAFDECISFTRYHPSKGYTWEFKEKQDAEEKVVKKEKKEEPSSLFQRQRVDMLLVELSKKFPPKLLQLEGPNQQPKPQQPSVSGTPVNLN